MFRKYMHIEKFGNDEVQGIEFGKCYIFSKLDGTNSSIWWNNEIQSGSRNRQLSLEEDNAGFYKWILGNEHCFKEFLEEMPCLRLYGEWLVPHSLKTYREEAWNKFYIFDVYNNIEERYLYYDEYKALLEKYNIDYVPALCIINNVTYDNLLIELENNKFLIEDGKGPGEGIVIKNYDYKNRFGRTTWAKLVTNIFKEKHTKEMGSTIKNGKQMIEQAICNEYITKHLINKTYAKIVNEMEGWSSKYIPRLLNTIYYDFINEEIWNVIKKMKNPIINFKTLNTLIIMKIKELKSEIF